MKSRLSRFLRKDQKSNEEPPISAYPQLDELLTFDNVTQRSMTGWIAYQLATQLPKSSLQKDRLFLNSFIKTDNHLDKETEKIMQLAQLATSWIQKDLLINEEIKKLNLDTEYSRVLSQVIREIQLAKDKQHIEDIEQKAIWKVYRDVIYSASQGRFLLVDKQDLAQFKTGELLCESEIKERSDIPSARNAATVVFEQVRLKPSKIMSYKLIVSEAVTNVLKHAEYGKLLIYRDELTNSLRIVVEDIGSGFPLKILPQTTLMAGFSTKKSLGQGFNLMLKMADQLVLETSNSGSTLILILKGENEHAENAN